MVIKRSVSADISMIDKKCRINDCNWAPYVDLELLSHAAISEAVSFLAIKLRCAR